MSNQQEYQDWFGLGLQPDKEKAEKALEHALNIRKFEIGLYWQRTAYFWALIAAAFAGYFAILGSEHIAERNYLAFIVSCIGALFTWAWFLVNRGSKYWQENWENHVDMLEDIVIGPLYKTRLCRLPDDDLLEKCFTGPMAVSVSKINQWVSAFTMFVWLMLVLHSLPAFSFTSTISTKHVAIGSVTVVAALLMLFKGRTYQGPYDHLMIRRETKIVIAPGPQASC